MCPRISGANTKSCIMMVREAAASHDTSRGAFNHDAPKTRSNVFRRVSFPFALTAGCHYRVCVRTNRKVSKKKKKKGRRRRKILDPQTLLGFQCCCQATILYFKSNLCFFISSSETGYRRKSEFGCGYEKKKPSWLSFLRMWQRRPFVTIVRKKDTICIQATC